MKGRWNPGRSLCAMLNKAAAYIAGFIGANRFPYCVASERMTVDFLEVRKPKGKSKDRPFTIDDLFV